jgi:hypothetical protein
MNRDSFMVFLSLLAYVGVLLICWPYFSVYQLVGLTLVYWPTVISLGLRD